MIQATTTKPPARARRVCQYRMAILLSRTERWEVLFKSNQLFVLCACLRLRPSYPMARWARRDGPREVRTLMYNQGGDVRGSASPCVHSPRFPGSTDREFSASSGIGGGGGGGVGSRKALQLRLASLSCSRSQPSRRRTAGGYK